MVRRAISGLWCACLLLLVTSCDEPAVNSSPASPDEAVRAIFVGLADHQPAVIWDAMPASWQTDVNGLFHLAVSQQEPELYDRSFAVVQRITAALDHNDVLRQAIRTKVAESDQLEPEFLDLAEVGLADLAVVSRVLGESDMRTHATASKADLGEMLRAAGPELMPIAFRWIDQAQKWQGPDVILPV